MAPASLSRGDLVKPEPAQIWGWLEDVPDPEIPVISVVDLGVVRDVSWAGETLQVAVTPTYSGCPATSVISMDIETALRDRGIDQVQIKMQIAPPWTTDWLSEAGKAKLLEYGIAPPNAGGGPTHCPRCASDAVSRISQYGSTPCKAQWRCDACLEPFEYFKCL